MKKNKESDSKNFLTSSGIKICDEITIGIKMYNLRINETKKIIKSGKEKQLSAKELGKLLDDKYKMHRYSQQKINNLESGKSLEFLDVAIYADHFHKSTDYFIYDFENPSLEESSHESTFGLTNESTKIIRSMSSAHKINLNYFIESGFIQDINKIFDDYKFDDRAIQLLRHSDQIIKEHNDAEKMLEQVPDIDEEFINYLDNSIYEDPYADNEDFFDYENPYADNEDSFDYEDPHNDNDPAQDYKDLMLYVISGVELGTNLINALDNYFKNSTHRNVKSKDEEGKIFTLMNERFFLKKIADIYARMPKLEKLSAEYAYNFSKISK